MKTFKISVLVIIALAGLSLAGCSKYDDGPMMSLYSKGLRVSGTWYFQSVYNAGKDSSSHYTYQQLSFIYVKEVDGGAFTWNHNLLATSEDEYPLEGGRWGFVSDRDSFEMITYRNNYKDSTITRWKIKRLAYTEFWLERPLKDTSMRRWQLIKFAY